MRQLARGRRDRALLSLVESTPKQRDESQPRLVRAAVCRALGLLEREGAPADSRHSLRRRAPLGPDDGAKRPPVDLPRVLLGSGGGARGLEPTAGDEEPERAGAPAGNDSRRIPQPAARLTA